MQKKSSRMHTHGSVQPVRVDGLHWLQCTECRREWAENDRGTFVRGSKVCARQAGTADGR